MVRRTATVMAFCVLLFCAGSAVAQEDDSPRGWMGVLLRPEPARPEEIDVQAPGGIRIARIVRNGPADQSGLRAGDVIRTVDSQPVDSVPGLIAKVSSLEPGSWISFDIERRGRERQVRVRLGTRPEETGRLDLREGWIGAEAIDLPPALREHFGAPDDAGVMVSGIDERGPAYAAGLDLGDVVYEIDGEPVQSSRQFLALVGGAGIGNPVEMLVMRSGVEIVLEPVVGEEPEEPREIDHRDSPDRG